MDPIDICWMDHPKLYPMPMSHQDLIIAIAYSMVYQTNYHKTPKCKKHTGTIGHQDGNIWSPWWRHQMETFSALLALCAEDSPVTDEFPSQRSVTQSFEVFFDLGLSNRLSKHSWGWWFETPSCPLWRHCNGYLSLENSKNFTESQKWPSAMLTLSSGQLEALIWLRGRVLIGL